MRTRMPQPEGHSVQKEYFVPTAACTGWGIHGQFCVQMDTSPSSLHGTGVSRSPAVAPALPISKSRLETFIVAPSLMTTEAAHLDMVAAMAIFTVAHLHAVMRSTSQTRDGMAPNIRALPADPVLFVNSLLIGFPEGSVAITARQARKACVDGMREPHIVRLPVIDQPRRLARRFYVLVNEYGFGFGRTEFIGMASRAGFNLGDSCEFAVGPQRVAGIALRGARFFTVSFVMKIQRLCPAHIQD